MARKTATRNRIRKQTLKRKKRRRERKTKGGMNYNSLTSSILSLSEAVIGSNSDPNSNFLLVEYITEESVVRLLGLVSLVRA